MSDESNAPGNVQYRNELSEIETLVKGGKFKALLKNYQIFEGNLRLKDIEEGDGNNRIKAIKKYVESIPLAFENMIYQKIKGFEIESSLDGELFRNDVFKDITEFEKNIEKSEALETFYQTVKNRQEKLKAPKIKNTEYLNESIDYFRDVMGVLKLNKPEKGFENLHFYRREIITGITEMIGTISRKENYFVPNLIYPSINQITNRFSYNTLIYHVTSSIPSSSLLTIYFNFIIFLLSH